MTEDRKLQAVAVPSATTQGFTIYVLRDPHPPQNVPVAFEILPMDEWSPGLAETLMADKWGWEPAPGATWQELSDGRYGIRPIIAKETTLSDAYTDHDEYVDDFEENDGSAEEWKPGECDNCYGGDENGVTATGPLGPLYCACHIGQGASTEDCRCGPPTDVDPEALEREREIQRHT